MADNKKGFILYADLIHTINKIDNENAGLLFKHLLAYVNDLNPECPNLIVEISFEPIKQQLKRDLKHWESVRLKRSEAGLASAESKKQKQQMLTSVESVEQNSTKSTVIVNDNVNVNVINIPFESFWNLYNKKVGDKKKVEKKWNKLKDDERQKIIDTLPNFLNSIQDKQFLPYPVTYLNQKRWNDEIVINSNVNKKHYYLSSPFGTWDGLLTEDEFKAKTLTNYWTLIKIG